MLLAPELMEANPQRELSNLARPRLHFDAVELPRTDFVHAGADLSSLHISEAVVQVAQSPDDFWRERCIRCVGRDRTGMSTCDGGAATSVRASMRRTDDSAPMRYE
jgi:hypothetical protein